MSAGIKVGGVAAAAIIALAGSGATYFHILSPEKAAPAGIVVANSHEAVARGEVIYNLASCDRCHSSRDFSRFGAPVREGGKGTGTVLPKEWNLPGRVTAPNITPDRETGIGGWTDGEVIRAIREGIGRDGSPLCTQMPYSAYRRMSDGDVESLVAYLRTLHPIRHQVPRTRLRFPEILLVRMQPKPSGPVGEPDRSNAPLYGEYLAAIGQCGTCHTRDDGKAFAGGRVMRVPVTQVVSANITPDVETGIGRWDDEEFLNRFVTYRDYEKSGAPVVGPEGMTTMPWLNLCKLPDRELKAIYAYLRSQPAVPNAVDVHPVAR